MKQETRQKKPYQGVQCKLIDYSEETVMFALSWTDRCGLSPLGTAMLKNAMYQSSLSEEGWYAYMDRLNGELQPSPSNPVDRCYPILGNLYEFFPYTAVTLFAERWFPLQIRDCAMNSEFYRSLPEDGVVDLCSMLGPKYDPSTYYC